MFCCWLLVVGCRLFSCLVVGCLVVGSFGWKPIPSVARVTRDAVSGITNNEGWAVWKTVPHWCAHSPLAHSPYSKSITDKPDATDLFFSRIFIVYCRIFGACRAQWLSRIISCWRLDRLNCSKLLLTTKPLNNYPAPYRRTNNPCSFRHWVFFNTDLSDWRGCFVRWEVLSSRQQSLYAL